MTICIYSLKFNDLIYIGQSNNVERRYRDHLNSLIDKTCHNYKMLDAYDLYGIPELNIVEECSIDKLDELEIYWINKFDSLNNGLNMCVGGKGGGYGVEHNRAIHTESTILKVIELLSSTPVLSYQDIAKLTGVSVSTITNIVTGNNHSWLDEKHGDTMKIIRSPSIRAQRLDLTNKARGSANRLAKTTGCDYPEVLSPDGTIYKISNAAKFAEEHNLCKAGLSRLLNGHIKSHRKWKLNGTTI